MLMQVVKKLIVKLSSNITPEISPPFLSQTFLSYNFYVLFEIVYF